MRNHWFSEPVLNNLLNKELRLTTKEFDNVYGKREIFCYIPYIIYFLLLALLLYVFVYRKVTSRYTFVTFYILFAVFSYINYMVLNNIIKKLNFEINEINEKVYSHLLNMSDKKLKVLKLTIKESLNVIENNNKKVENIINNLLKLLLGISPFSILIKDRYTLLVSLILSVMFLILDIGIIKFRDYAIYEVDIQTYLKMILFIMNRIEIEKNKKYG